MSKGIRHILSQRVPLERGHDYKETFSPVFMKHSFRIIRAHFDLELYQMDVKIAFLNGNIEKEICMVQPESFKLKVS